MEKFLLIRGSKILLIAGIGCLSLMVASNNVLAYQSNFLFVQHVMSMDTVFTGNVLKSRAITEPLLHSVAYTSVILWEFGVAILCLSGALQLLKHLKAMLPGLIKQNFCRSWACPPDLPSGFLALWWLAGNGSACGNHRTGMVRNQLFDSWSALSWC